MAPKTNDNVILTASSAYCEDDTSTTRRRTNANATDPTASPSLSASRTLLGIHKIPLLDLKQPVLSAYSTCPAGPASLAPYHCPDVNVRDLQDTRDVLRNHVETLLQIEQTTATAKSSNAAAHTEESLVLAACFSSLHTRMPIILAQAEGMIDNAQQQQQQQQEWNDTNSAALLVAKIRSSLALSRAARYLDKIEAGLSAPACLNETLAAVRQGMIKRGLSLSTDDAYSFHVSPWIVSSLAFDMPAGETVTTSIASGDMRRGGLPLHLDVEPVAEIVVSSPLAGQERAAIPPTEFMPCRIQIEKCTHSAHSFSTGAGTIGEALIRLRVSPLNEVACGLAVWEKDQKDVEPLTIKEARAIQVNAYPPKPKASVDLYTSYVYGDACVTVTLIIKTCVTKHGEPPHLHVELSLAPMLSNLQ